MVCGYQVSNQKQNQNRARSKTKTERVQFKLYTFPPLMALQFVLKTSRTSQLPQRIHIPIRYKTTSSQYVASRPRDPTFEKLMKTYKNLIKVVTIQDLILTNPKNPTLPVSILSQLAQKLHLNRGALAFLRKYPHIFSLFYSRSDFQPFCKLTETAMHITCQEALAVNASIPIVADRLIRLVTMSVTKTLPLRAVFKVWRELGLPDDFEKSVIERHCDVFTLCDGNEPKTHVLKLVDGGLDRGFAAAVENWRREECGKEDSKYNVMDIRYAFKHSYPPGMKLSKDFRARVKEWQGLAYVGPYDEMVGKRNTKAGLKGLEKRAVAIVHEFLSLTVEKMVEVEKISHFRKWFGIDLNIRDLFLDHPGIFYLSTKGKTHTVFLREAYEKGRLIDRNPVYDARRKLLDLVVLGRRGLFLDDSGRSKSTEVEEACLEDDDSD